LLPLSAKIPFNWRELTPVSVIALDQFVLWDNTPCPQEREGIHRGAKAANPPSRWAAPAPSAKTMSSTVFLEKRTGAKFAYLPYKSGGEAATQLVGNHTQSNVNNPSENLESGARPGARAVRVRQGAHPVQDQGHGHAILERHPDLQGRRRRRAVS